MSIAPADSDDPGDSSHLISTKALAQGVLAVPGFAFMPSEKRNPYVRCSYSLATEEQADEVSLRPVPLVSLLVLVAGKRLIGGYHRA